MLNITNDSGNENQNQNVIPPYSCKNDYNEKKFKNICWYGCGKREIFYTACGKVK